jgi:hypothetical protein
LRLAHPIRSGARGTARATMDGHVQVYV